MRVSPYIRFMFYTSLPERGLIRLFGDDTLSFLQGLVSNDVLHLPHKGIVYAALLTPQGKFLHDFFLIDWQGAVLIDCEKQRLPDLIKRLSMYKLRSKITIEALPESMGVVAMWNPCHAALVAAPPSITGRPRNECGVTVFFSDPRLPELGWRAVGEIAVLETWCREQNMQPADAIAYDRMRLELGVPDGSRDLIVEKSTLLPFGFEQLHGVDFNKGCYVGQEVTARTKHIGQMRKFLHKITLRNNVPPLPGAPIYLGEEMAGTLGSWRDGTGLALLNCEAVEKAKKLSMDLRCGEAALTAEIPKWAK